VNEAALVRSAPDVSNLAEKIDLLRRSAYGCVIMLNNMQPQQALAQYLDAKKMLREVQELVNDLDRKLQEGDQ
jgi:hypothetical protein